MTAAFSVAKFTDAATPSIALRFFSTLAAHAAHVIPRTESSTSRSPDDALPVSAATPPPAKTGQPARQVINQPARGWQGGTASGSSEAPAHAAAPESTHPGKPRQHK